MSDSPLNPPLCAECKQNRVICFCGAPRAKELYEKRLNWANIEHPASDNLIKKIDRMLAEPQRWVDFAKEMERENSELRSKIEEMETDAYNSMVERSLRDHD